MRLPSCLLVLLCVVSAPLRAEAADHGTTPGLPAHHAADPAAAVVTARNLLSSDRFWPYQVSLVAPWTPPERTRALPAGTRGVLIRVEAADLARIDFGRDGLHAVPVEKTDLLALANRVRTGELAKTAPNLALAIGPRLLDPGAPSARPFDFVRAIGQRGFLAVFADPSSEGFAEMARALAPFREREGVLTVLFPQSRRSDAQVAEQLRALDWPVPFLMDHMSEPFAGSLLPDETTPPAVMLQTSEGRVLYGSRWSPEAIPALRAALEASFSEPPR
jgi:hypothetical protein